MKEAYREWVTLTTSGQGKNLPSGIQCPCQQILLQCVENMH